MVVGLGDAELRNHVAQVDLAIGLAEEWREAIAEEILARQVQHRRFFATSECLGVCM